MNKIKKAFLIDTGCSDAQYNEKYSDCQMCDMVNTCKAITELDRIESEKPDVCKTDCEFYEGCLKTFTHKESEKPVEDAIAFIDQACDGAVGTYMSERFETDDYGKYKYEMTIKLLQFAERYHQLHKKEENDADAIAILNYFNSRDQSRMDDGMCEWLVVNDGIGTEYHCLCNGEVYDHKEKFKYCGNCGKPIKVIE